MFQGAGNSSPRKRAEAVSNPVKFQDLVGYDTVQGRPLNTRTQGFYAPVMVNIGMTPPSTPELVP